MGIDIVISSFPVVRISKGLTERAIRGSAVRIFSSEYVVAVFVLAVVSFVLVMHGAFYALVV